MKTILSFLLALLLGLLLSSCRTTKGADATSLAESMKGYELYSWQEGNHWVFSLLVGTNREKTLDEIKSTDSILPDVDALIAILETVPSGQYVTWSSRKTLSFPPDDIVKQVEKVCKDKGLKLNIFK
jgi:predicted small secreted protein